MRKLCSILACLSTALILMIILGVHPTFGSIPGPERPSRTLIVDSTADSGPGTLRQALLDARSGDTVLFDKAEFPPGDPATIAVKSELPALDDGNVTIDGSNAGLILDGSEVPHGIAALSIRSNGNRISGLQIVRFPGSGIVLDGGTQQNLIGGDRSIGSGALGQGNLISGNGNNGIEIRGSGTISNTVSGNHIGVDLEGSKAWGNDSNGVFIDRGAESNTIGGTTPGKRNIISGSHSNQGVHILGAHGNRVIGNHIGVDASGTLALANLHSGVLVSHGARDNIIGGLTGEERNLISGNGTHGVDLQGSDTMDNIVCGNYIGTDASGTGTIPNRWEGVRIGDGASQNLIGGENETPGGGCTSACNLLSGNDNNGVTITGFDTARNTVSGNYIGVNASGTAALGNISNGVYIAEEASHNLIGGATVGERNLISGSRTNHGVGIGRSHHNKISGNYIGVDASGTIALGNYYGGISMRDAAQYNVVGGTTSAERNLLSGNGTQGVSIRESGTTNNTVSANYIGTDHSGTAPLPNRNDGVEISQGARDNVVGGSGTAEGNVIAFNRQHGVVVYDSGSVHNTITRNSIHDNRNSGIELGGGNEGLSVPVITGFDQVAGTATGTACASCTVEVFSDEEDEGRVYEGTATASAGGAWTMAKGSPLAGPWLTATATDPQGNTSAFSAPTQAGRRTWAYLPVAPRRWSVIPGAPVLQPIGNADGDGNYAVRWSSIPGMTRYGLEEATDLTFANGREVYEGPGTEFAVTGRGAARYFYRVQGRGAEGNSPWSNVQSVDVLWEAEPNDDARTQANGPIVSGLTYYGRFPSSSDVQDYFTFVMPAAQRVELWLSNIPSGRDYDVYLRDADLALKAKSDRGGNADEHLRTDTLPAGQYFIQVYNRSQSGSQQAYHLRVAYK